MRICFLAEANSAHTRKWCRWFLDRGYLVDVVSFTAGEIPGAKVHHIDLGLTGDEGDRAKLRYLTQGPRVRRLVKEIAPDIISVHYATSYGAVAALAGLKGYALSVWGSDIYDFPAKSPLHRILLRFSLSRASMLLSTSRAMAKETRKYTRKPIRITPFGVDTDLFCPAAESRVGEGESGGQKGRTYRIGTVKKLEPKYGIDHLLMAAAKLKKDHADLPLQLVIAGKGTAEEEYHRLADKLGIAEYVDWKGYISQEEAARVWASLDIAVIPSTMDSESFGVAAVEAEAAGIPVVISDVPGLMEATRPGYTSLVVQRNDPDALAAAIGELLADEKKRKKMGRYGRRYAVKRYGLVPCFQYIEECLLELKTRRDE